MPHWLKYTLLTLLFLMLAAVPLAMQFESGTISGVVIDNQGPISSASIHVRNVFNGTTVDTHSDSSGAYKVEGLRPGRYSLRVQAPDHDERWIPEVSVGRGQSVREDFFLARTVVSTQLR